MSSRTPLLAALRTSFARSAAGGDGSPALSRRTVLKAAGAAAVATGLAAVPATPARAAAGLRVAVVGAGLAGLSAADRLCAAGAQVTVYEAQRRVGGRVMSVPEFLPGQAIELGGELIDTDHTTMRGLAERFGLTLDDYRLDTTVAQDTYFFRGRAYAEDEIVAAFTPVRDALVRDLAELDDGDITYLTPRNAQRLDELSIDDWLSSHRITGVIRDLLDVAYTTEYGLEIDRQSALNLLSTIGTKTGEFEIFGASDERFHVRGGNQQIPQALADSLRAEVRLGWSLQDVRRTAAGRYALSFADGVTGRDVTADAVVLAIPLTTLRQVRLDIGLTPVQERHIRETAYGTNAKLMIGYDERVWRERYHTNGSVYSDLSMQTLWETSRLLPGKQGVLTNFTGGEAGVALGEGAVAGQVQRVLRDADQIFPGIAATQRGLPTARFHWPSFRYALGSYACPTPGWWTALRGALSTAAGGVHFAGEHTSLGYGGFMEGAARSGVDAAESLLKQVSATAVR
ncbi:flavin monoamine oxidase family protein [Amycolatopsis sp. NPDC004378]